MAFCPECSRELGAGVTECYYCGCDLTEDAEKKWVVLGTIDSKLYADFAKETLASYNIPAVVISKSGFFGNIGLPLHPFYRSRAATFEICVPAMYQDDAAEILDMVAGKSWRRREQ